MNLPKNTEEMPPKNLKSKKTPKPQVEAIENLLPASGRLLLTGGGKEFIEKLGVEAAKQVVLGVLKGDNIRAQTEPLTRRRVALVSNAMISLFTEGWLTNPDFTAHLSDLAVRQITGARKSDNATIWPAQWLIGLTGKSAQNIMRGRAEARDLYLEEFESAIRDAAERSAADFGATNLTLGFVEDVGQARQPLTWLDLTRLATAIGCATLTIRGSDKSTYGKLFERLVLGAVLTLMGFEYVQNGTNPKIERVFWLSDSSDTRECDATIRFKANKFIRIDIGFIGEGNPEIAKDKLTRYSSELERGEVSALSKTFIIIDKMPKTTKTLEAAAKSGAEIIQMSMSYWPLILAAKLQQHLGMELEILAIQEEDLAEYLASRIAPIKIQDFLVGITAADLDTQSELPSASEQVAEFEDE
jgi:hypothetical protein